MEDMDEKERLAQKDAYIAEHLMDLQPDTLRFLVADVVFHNRKLTALCDGYRGERDELKSDIVVYKIHLENALRAAKANGKLAEQAESALTRARAEGMEFEKAKAHISGDRLGSYTLCGQWTLTADLTTEEIENSHYRTALERGRAEGMEAGAVIAETISMPSFGSDAKWDGYEMATEDIASAIRLAKDKL